MTQHTPGPWMWYGNAGGKSLYLATTHSGRRWVMGFKRWGMSGAQPMFQPEARGLVPASDICTFAVGDRSVRGTKEAAENSSVYRLDIDGIDCADARLIAAAPDLLEALVAILGPLNLCSDNANVRDDTCLPADLTMGEVRLGRAAIAKATGAPSRD